MREREGGREGERTDGRGKERAPSAHEPRISRCAEPTGIQYFPRARGSTQYVGTIRIRVCVCAEFVLADISVGPRRTITDCETEIRGIADFPILFCAACVQQPLPPDTCACVYYVYVCV